ncbi:MAG: hypothetical protein V4736_11020 [Bdellovibrionota bacterium]
MIATLVTGSLFALLLSGCGNSSENSMMTDGKNKLNCPEGGCADATAKSTDVSLRLNKSTTQYITSSTGRLEVQGECFASTYPENYIGLTFKKAGAAMTPPPTVAMTAIAGKLACENGKFYFIMDTSGLAQDSYNVVGQMYVKPLNGTFQLISAAKFSLNFIKTP